jgi:hypothetical protein
MNKLNWVEDGAIEGDILYELPYYCEHPYNCLTIDNISFNGRIGGFGITFHCEKCDTLFTKWVTI